MLCQERHSWQKDVVCREIGSLNHLTWSGTARVFVLSSQLRHQLPVGGDERLLTRVGYVSFVCWIMGSHGRASYYYCSYKIPSVSCL